MSATQTQHGTFASITLPLAAKNIPCTPVRPQSKAAFLPNFPATATTDANQLLVWDAQYPNHNAGCVARAEAGGIWILEIDSPDVVGRIKAETGQDLNSLQTFRVRSRAGRGHIFFHQSAASIQMGNLSQSYVKGQDFSARVDGQYTVAAGSIHPETGEPYKALNDLPLIEAPEWLIQWLISQKTTASTSNSKPDPTRNAAGKIPHGSIHGWLVSQAGRMRNAGLTVDEIEPALLRVAYEECEEPLDDAKIIQVARSMSNYEAGRAGYALTANLQPDATQQAAAPAVEPITPPTFKTLQYPKFPSWVMEGTSIYDGFVKPYCEKNSRIDYFMWLPAMVMLLNYLGGKVSVPFKDWSTSIYLVVLGKRGKANKSSSVASGKKFFEFASCLTHYSKDIKSAEGRTLVWEVGSPEGLGTEMQKTNCKNAILHYDEFSGLVSKAGIEGSGMAGALLKMYESQLFANSVKSKKDCFSLAPHTYTLSLISSNTLQTFGEKWGQFAYNLDGMEDRFTFLLEPQTLPELKNEETVPFIEAALETRKLIDRAVNQKEFKFLDQSPLLALGKKYGNRPMIRAEKWALAIAVDLGLDCIDEDAVERGIALVEYEMAVKKYLMAQDAESKMAAWQQEVIRILQYQKDGRMPMLGKSGLRTAMRANRFDTKTWSAIVLGLKGVNHIALTGKGTKADPEFVQLLQTFDGYEGDDE